MSEKICVLSTGDDVYFYDKSIVIFFNGKRKILSTSAYNGGYHEDYEAVYNYDAKKASGMPCEILADTYVEHMKLISQRLAVDPEKVSGMGTAASMENAVYENMTYKDLTVTAIVTAGIEHNGGRAGDPADFYQPVTKADIYGTINIMLILDCDISVGTMARALVTCTEAKTAAIQELLAGSNYSTGFATGSGTDQTIIIANTESDLCFDNAGKHSKLGELIGKVVIRAVKKALEKQNGLNPESQHNAFRRLKRFGVFSDKLWQQYKEKYPGLIKPQYLMAAEKIAKDEVLLTYTSLYIHLLDQLEWNLINVDEAIDGMQSVLDILADKYNVNRMKVSGESIDDFVKIWESLFNSIVATSLDNI